jgi:hypothetical protein
MVAIFVDRASGDSSALAAIDAPTIKDNNAALDLLRLRKNFNLRLPKKDYLLLFLSSCSDGQSRPTARSIPKNE